MSRNSTSAIGAFHPVLFFILVYTISIFMALFVCRAVYIGVHGDPDMAQTEAQNDNPGFASVSAGSSTASLR